MTMESSTELSLGRKILNLMVTASRVVFDTWSSQNLGDAGFCIANVVSAALASAEVASTGLK